MRRGGWLAGGHVQRNNVNRLGIFHRGMALQLGSQLHHVGRLRHLQCEDAVQAEVGSLRQCLVLDIAERRRRGNGAMRAGEGLQRCRILVAVFELDDHAAGNIAPTRRQCGARIRRLSSRRGARNE